VLAGLLPHGIFELPALVLGEACALSIGAAVITGMTNREKRGIIKTVIRSNLKYLGVTAGLFLAAAVVETWLTPRLLEMVG
jgi:stage II sporulation protein M